MPPKKSGKKGQEADAPALPLTVVRPSTPNDFRIVATVRALQELVNTETKWKNRLIVASRDETVVRAKIARVHQLVALCEKGIAQCLANVEALVEEQFNMVSSEPSQVAAWQHGAHALLPGGNLSCAPPQSAANGGGAAGKTAADAKSTQGAAGNAKPAAGLASGKGGGAAALAAAASRPSDASMFPPGYRPENEASLAGVPPGFWEQRQKQKELLRTMLLALYQTPRLTRERQVQRPSSPVEMQHELEEATRLATPIAELMAMQNSKLVAKTPKAVGGGGAAASKAAKNAKGGASGDKNVVLDDTTSIAESEVMHLLSGDLSSYDCLVLPTPRGLDAKLLHRVQMQRSRRLRLEASIALFKAELPGLESRLRCIADMSSVGQYSLSAVAPAVVRTIEEEVALQRVRVQEDEAFQLRRAATPSGAGTGSSGVPSRRPVSTPPTA